MAGKRGPRDAPTKRVGDAKNEPKVADEPALKIRPHTRRAPPMPTTLSKEAKAEWKRILPILKARGIMRECDRGTLATYCEAYADVVRYTAALKEHGHVYTASNGDPRARPEVAMLAKARSTTLAFAKEFGLTSKSRKDKPMPVSEKTEGVSDAAKKKEDPLGAVRAKKPRRRNA